MKTRLLIILTIVTVTLVSLLASDQYYLSLQDKEMKKSDWVKNCISVGTDRMVPSIGLYNHTHSFDLLTCTWNTTEHGAPGFLESLYTSFVESVFLDIVDGLEMNYAYASCVYDYLESCFDGFIKHDEKFTEHSLRNYFADYADRIYKIYDYPNKSDDMKNNFTGFPAVVCYEIIADKKPYLLMAMWVDNNTISDVKNYYAPELCEVTLNPFYEESRPDSLFKKLDVPNCKWITENEFPTYMDIGCYPEPLGNPLRDISLSDGYDPQRLEFIQAHCETYGPLPYAGPFRYLNTTHLIDIDTCEWDTRINSGIGLDRTVYPTPYVNDDNLIDNLIKNRLPIGENIYMDFTFFLVVLGGVIVGVLFVIRRKRK